MNKHQGARIRSVLRGVVIVVALNLPTWAMAQMEADDTSLDTGQARFEIGAQDLTQALTLFARQSGQELLYAPEDAAGLRSSGVSGAMSRSDAIQTLLQGTGLAFEFHESGSMLIGSPAVIDAYRANRARSGAAATGTASRFGNIEEVIVTGQKREERIQDVPIAITAFTMDDLNRSQITGGPDLITQVPNFTFTKTNFSGYSIQIRGIGTQAISATTDPAVAVALNNVPFIRNRFFEQEFFDLERAEILRGPQGTLYGRNATAGVVNLISAKPKFFTEAFSTVNLGNYQSHRLEQMFNIPLVEDAVALRFAGAWTKRDGYVENELTGSPVDGRDLWSTRTSLRIKPNDRLDVNLIWEHFEENDDRLRSAKQLCHKDVVTEVGGIATPDYFQTLPLSGQNKVFAGVQGTFSQGCKRHSLYSAESFQTPNGIMLPYYLALDSIGLPAALTDPYLSAAQPQNLRMIQSTIDPQYRAKSDIGELLIDFALTDTLTLSSETSYADDMVYSLQDFNRFNTAPGAWEQPGGSMREGVLAEGEHGGIFCDPQLGCSDRLVAVDVSSAQSRQFSQELRLASSFDGPFNFSIGANYLRYSTEEKYYIFFNSTTLISALVSSHSTYRPYVGGVTDNTDCLANGYQPGDPTGVYSVTSCTYIDPNPISHVNDRGHNYFLSRNPYELRSYAAFGEIYYNLADNLKLTAGLRWSVDRKDAPRIPSWVLASQSYGYPVETVVKQEWREPTGRIVLDWKPDLPFTDETLIYGSYSRGYKAGGANPPGFVRAYYADIAVARSSAANSLSKPRVFDAEYVNAFEIGTKNTFLDGRLTANLAAFYYDYEGYQISEIVDRAAYNHNYDTEVWGAELELDWLPLENLRFGLKAGYQKTRIADGELAIDFMDRTAGNPDWLLVRPFPTYASGCILPVWIYAHDGMLNNVGNPGGGGAGGCELAYVEGVDPVTQLPYVPNPTLSKDGILHLNHYTDYPGFDPSTAPNGGEGFAKDLGGNELPNAPNYTLSLTADWTLPLGQEWLMTLHADYYWQAKSWWRMFNDHEYGRLQDYYTANLAAIFSNDRAGWTVMAYVKNVTNETAISGAFMNSDDTGLTTNIFLTNPRLFGVSVTKHWSGLNTLGGFGARGGSGPWPVTLELGGMVPRIDAPNATLSPSFASEFDSTVGRGDQVQHQGLGWGQGRELGLSWRPDNGPWRLSLNYRQGQVRDSHEAYGERWTDPLCAWTGGMFAFHCTNPNAPPLFKMLQEASQANYVLSGARRHERYTLFDLGVSRQLGSGEVLRSELGVAVRRARFASQATTEMRGTPDWIIPENISMSTISPGVYMPGELSTHTLYDGLFQARRDFEGTGLVMNWEGGVRVFGSDQAGHVVVDWTLLGGALYGDQRTTISGFEGTRLFRMSAAELTGTTNNPTPAYDISEVTLDDISRSDSVIVPVVGGSLGLSYRIGGVTASAGYRWERYINAIDGGHHQRQREDRTIDGPTLKLRVDFGY